MLSDAELMQPARIGAGLAIPRFEVRAVQDEAKSEIEGRPIFRDADWVNFMHPGDIKTAPSYEVTPQRLADWPDVYRTLYKRWKETRSNTLPGTPLEMWPRMTPSRVAELKAAGLQTVEQVAEASSDVVEKFRLSREQAQAQEYLKPEAEAIRESRQREAKMAAELEDLKARLAQVEGGKKAGK